MRKNLSVLNLNSRLDNLGWITGYDTIIRNILGYYAASSNNNFIANSYSRHNDGIDGDYAVLPNVRVCAQGTTMVVS